MWQCYVGQSSSLAAKVAAVAAVSAEVAGSIRIRRQGSAADAVGADPTRPGRPHPGSPSGAWLAGISEADAPRAVDMPVAGADDRPGQSTKAAAAVSGHALSSCLRACGADHTRPGRRCLAHQSLRRHWRWDAAGGVLGVEQWRCCLRPGAAAQRGLVLSRNSPEKQSRQTPL